MTIPSARSSVIEQVSILSVTFLLSEISNWKIKVFSLVFTTWNSEIGSIVQRQKGMDGCLSNLSAKAWFAIGRRVVMSSSAVEEKFRRP
jgi:hypothetical protein